MITDAGFYPLTFHPHFRVESRYAIFAPIAVVNGADDAIINLDYFDTVNFADLWEGQCYRLPGVGHAPFWAVPEKFNPLLERFLEYTGAGK